MGLVSFAEWIRNERLAVLNPPIAFFRLFLKWTPEEEKFPDCEHVVLSGESICQSDLDMFRRLFGPNCQLIYEYGSTEAGGISVLLVDEKTHFTDSAVPIGYTYEGIEVRILDPKGDAVSHGCIGEIAVVSDYLALGYWRKPKITEQSFKVLTREGNKRMYRTGDLGHIDENGLIFYHGRADSQVKVMGYRVELGAIESFLNDLAEIDQAVVLTCRGFNDSTELIAYVQLAGPNPISIRELRRKCVLGLPDYMLPNEIIAVDEMPLNASNKIDRPALASHGRTQKR